MSLSSILGNTQTPHQPFLVVCDTPTLSGQPVLKELVRRNIEENTAVAFVCVLHPPAAYGLDSARQNVRILDLTDDAALFYSEERGADSFLRIEGWLKATVDELGKGVQVYIDALDLLAEDYDSPSRAVRVVKSALQLLRGLKAPSRLVLLLPSYSSLLDHIIAPTISTSPTLTLLTLHPPPLLAHLANTYLVAPPSSGALDSATEPSGLRFWGILNASDGVGTAGWAGGQAGDRMGKGKGRAEGVRFGLTGEEMGEKSGLVVDAGDWTGLSGLGDESGTAAGGGRTGGANGGVVAQVLVRKQQGGANKGMLRSLEGLRPARSGGAGWCLAPCRWDELEGLEEVGRTYVGGGAGVAPEQGDRAEQSNQEQHHPSQQHIPFNLSLTPAQQASRAQVPIPYAHEGDDAPSNRYDTVATGGIIFEPGSEDDMDDDDPDEDLDF